MEFRSNKAYLSRPPAQVRQDVDDCGENNPDKIGMDKSGAIVTEATFQDYYGTQAGARDPENDTFLNYKERYHEYRKAISERTVKKTTHDSPPLTTRSHIAPQKTDPGSNAIRDFFTDNYSRDELPTETIEQIINYEIIDALTLALGDAETVKRFIDLNTVKNNLAVRLASQAQLTTKQNRSAYPVGSRDGLPNQKGSPSANRAAATPPPSAKRQAYHQPKHVQQASSANLPPRWQDNFAQPDQPSFGQPQPGYARPEPDISQWLNSLLPGSQPSHSETLVLKSYPPNKLSKDQFQTIMSAWKALKNNQFALNFHNYWQMVNGNSDLHAMLQTVCEGEQNRYSTGDSRALHQACSNIMRYWLRTRSPIAFTADDIKLFTPASLSNPRLPETVQALGQYISLHQVFYKDMSRLSTEDIAWAASEEGEVSSHYRQKLNELAGYSQDLIGKLAYLGQIPAVSILFANKQISGVQGYAPTPKALSVLDKMIDWERSPGIYDRQIKGSSIQLAFNAGIQAIGLQHLLQTTQEQLYSSTISHNCRLSWEEAGKVRRHLQEMYHQFSQGQLEDIHNYMAQNKIPVHQQTAIQILLEASARQSLHSLKGTINQLAPLLDAANVVYRLERSISDTKRYHAPEALNRDVARNMLDDQLHCTLGARTAPSGNCGYHAAGMQVGLSARQVRDHMQQTAADIIAMSEDRGSTGGPCTYNVAPEVVHNYYQRVEAASRNGNVVAAAKGRQDFIKLKDPSAELAGLNNWLTTDDLHIMAVAFGKPVVLSHSPDALPAAEGKPPICQSWYSGETGELNFEFEGNPELFSDLMHNKDAIGIGMLDTADSGHIEPIVPIREKGPVKNLKPETPVPPQSTRKHNITIDNKQPPAHKVKRNDDGVAENTLLEDLDNDIHRVYADVGDMTKSITPGAIREAELQIPLDPNLICPITKRQFRIGQIQQFREHYGRALVDLALNSSNNPADIKQDRIFRDLPIPDYRQDKNDAEERFIAFANKYINRGQREEYLNLFLDHYADYIREQGHLKHQSLLNQVLAGSSDPARIADEEIKKNVPIPEKGESRNHFGIRLDRYLAENIIDYDQRVNYQRQCLQHFGDYLS